MTPDPANQNIEHLAVAQIRAEHRGIQQALNGIAEALASARPDFDAVHALLTWLDAFPEDIHHPKEERLLFAMLAERTDRANALLTALQAEHEHCAGELARMLDLLAGARAGRGEDLAALGRSFQAYAGFYRAHMGLEEDGLLPIAHEHLHAEDWRTINAGFATSLDPLASGASPVALQTLLTGALARLHAGIRARH